MPEIITDPYLVATTRNTMAYPWYNLYNEEQLAYAKKCSEDPSTSPYFLNPDGSYTYFGRTNWVDEAYNDVGFSTIHNIDISGKQIVFPITFREDTIGRTVCLSMVMTFITDITCVPNYSLN